jgi:hypothetical protein
MRAAAHQNENREDASVRSGTWKAVIRKPGPPTVAKTFRSNVMRMIGRDGPKTKWSEGRSFNALRVIG